MSDVEQLTSLYIQLRDKIAATKRRQAEELAPLNEGLGRLELALRSLLEQLNIRQFRSEAGTVYTAVKSTVSVADREAFTAFVRTEPEGLSFMDVRADHSTVLAYRDTQGRLPPGVAVRDELTLHVNRPRS